MTPISIPSSPNPSFSIHPCTPADISSMLTIYDLAFATDPFRLARWPSSQVSPSVFTSWLTKVFTKYLHTPHTHTWKLVENSTGNMAGWTHWAEPHVLSREEKERVKIEEETGEGKFPEGSVLDICEAKVRGWDALREKWYKSEEMFCMSRFSCFSFRQLSFFRLVLFSICLSEYFHPFHGNFPVFSIRTAWIDRYLVSRPLHTTLTSLLPITTHLTPPVIYFLSISPSYQKLGLGTLLLTAITNLADEQAKSSYLEATAAGYPVYVRAGFKEVDCMEVGLGECGVGRNWAMIRSGGKE